MSLRGQQGRLARQGLQRRAGESRHRRAGRRALPHHPDRQARGPAAGRSRRREAAQAADLRGRRQGGDAQGVRRRAGRGRRRPAGRGGAGRRGLQLDHADEFKKAFPDRFFEMFIAEQQLVSAAVGLGRAGQEGVRLDVRRLLHPGLRPDPHGRDLQRHHPPVRLARRGQHRRGRPVADGPGRPGDDAGRLRQHRPLPLRPEPDGRSSSTRWWTCRASPSCAPPARRRR